MALREIKTTIALDGEREFKRELAEAGRELRVLGSELKAAAAEFSVTGDKQKLLTTKSGVLRREMQQQEAIVRALEGALADVRKDFGENSKEADGYAIKLNNARTKLSQLKKQLNDTEKELEDTEEGFEDSGKEARDFGRILDRNVTDEVRDAGRELNRFEGDLVGIKDELQDIKGFEKLRLGIDFAQGAAGLVQGLFDYANAAREYNRQLAYLEINAQNAGIDASVAESEAFEAASYIGDLESALEGVNNLMASGLDVTQFVQAMDLLTGAALRFPDTLKFESLADSFQETIASGSAAGQFSELLSRLGVDVESFNEGLAKAKTNGEEVDYALTWLSQHGLANQKRAFQEANPEMVKAEAATLALEKAWNSFGTSVDLVATPIKNFFTNMLETAAGYLDNIRENWDEMGLASLFVTNTGSGELTDVDWLTPEEKVKIEFEDHMISVGKMVGKMMENLPQMIEQAEMQSYFNDNTYGWQDFIDSLGGGGHSGGGGSFGTMGGHSGGGGSFGTMGGLTGAAGVGAALANGIKEGMSSPQFEYVMGVMMTQLEEGSDEAEDIGGIIANNLENGINQEAPGAINAARDMVDRINAHLSMIGKPGMSVIGGMFSGAIGGGVSNAIQTVNLNVDGQTLTRIMLPHINEQQGLQSRYS